MATYLIRKDKFAAIDWDGSNITDIQDFVANLPNFDNYYTQFTGAQASVSGTICTVSWSGSGGGSLGLDVGGVFVEGLIGSGGLVVDGTNHPLHYRIDI